MKRPPYLDDGDAQDGRAAQDDSRVPTWTKPPARTARAIRRAAYVAGMRRLMVSKLFLENLLMNGSGPVVVEDKPLAEFKVLDARDSPTWPGTLELLVSSTAWEGGTGWKDAVAWTGPKYQRKEA